MRPISRHKVNKYRSAKKFRSKAMHTKKANLTPPPMRGGYRL